MIVASVKEIAVFFAYLEQVLKLTNTNRIILIENTRIRAGNSLDFFLRFIVKFDFNRLNTK